jgi:hypothetical protein
MNPETEYPELKSMKASEVFINCICIVKHSGERDKLPQKTKINIHKLICKSELNNFIQEFKKQYNIITDSDENKNKELINVSIITK